MSEMKFYTGEIEKKQLLEPCQQTFGSTRDFLAVEIREEGPQVKFTGLKAFGE